MSDRNITKEDGCQPSEAPTQAQHRPCILIPASSIKYIQNRQAVDGIMGRDVDQVRREIFSSEPTSTQNKAAELYE